MYRRKKEASDLRKHYQQQMKQMREEADRELEKLRREQHREIAKMRENRITSYAEYQSKIDELTKENARLRCMVGNNGSSTGHDSASVSPATTTTTMTLDGNENVRGEGGIFTTTSTTSMIGVGEEIGGSATIAKLQMEIMDLKQKVSTATTTTIPAYGAAATTSPPTPLLPSFPCTNGLDNGHLQRVLLC